MNFERARFESLFKTASSALAGAEAPRRFVP